MEELKRMREQLGWTQQKLADESGVDRATINQVEGGRRSPTIATLESLAGAMGAEVADFFPKAQASLFETSEQRRLSYLSAWTNLINELAGDVEEWQYEWSRKGEEPAGLPERDFLLYVGGVASLGQAYQRIKRTVYEELLPTLQAEADTEQFERAFRRLSRVVGKMATPAVEQRIERMEQEEKESKEMRSNIRLLKEARTA